MQSASAMHVVRHCPFASHWKGAQELLLAPTQLPIPSQRPAVFKVAFVQPGCWQIVPAEYF